LTKWRYFYATLDVALIDSHDDPDHSIGLQPRYLIPERVFELFRHFQRHPVLQPSIGRVVSNRIRLFNGQHKVAGLLWAGRRQFECKIYTTCDIRLLNLTNIFAHDAFAQIRFFSSIMVMKLGALFGTDFEI
jgi:uroporphyrinogen-III synthase